MRRFRPLRIALATLAVLGPLVTGCTASSTSPAVEAVTTSATSAAPEASAGSPDYVLMAQVADEAVLEAGRYGLTPIGPSTFPLAVVDVPAGFIAGPLLFPADASDDQADYCCVMGYWTVSRVYQDPCKADAATDPGPSVQDLADALVAQTTASTEPAPVTLDGYSGLYLELTAPPGLKDLGACRESSVFYWESDPGDRWFGPDQYDPSQGLPLERLWILDVDGQRVVLSVGTQSGTTDQQAQPLVDIVESVEFVPA